MGQVADVAARAADTKGDPLGQILVTSTSNPSFASLQQSSDQESSRSRKPSFSKLSSVQSFPSLRPRSSTAEWRKAPLVDLNDPLAGRVTEYQINSHSGGLGTNVGSSVAGRKEEWSSQLYDTAGGRRWGSGPHAYARLGSCGSIGSGIGASSRKRVMSRPKI